MVPGHHVTLRERIGFKESLFGREAPPTPKVTDSSARGSRPVRNDFQNLKGGLRKLRRISERSSDRGWFSSLPGIDKDDPRSIRFPLNRRDCAATLFSELGSQSARVSDYRYTVRYLSSHYICRGCIGFLDKSTGRLIGNERPGSGPPSDVVCTSAIKMVRYASRIARRRPGYHPTGNRFTGNFQSPK